MRIRKTLLTSMMLVCGEEAYAQDGEIRGASAPSMMAVDEPAGDNGKGDDDGARLEDIVVTAQRRGENMQDVPIAITAITAAAAERLGVNNVDMLTQLAPGVTFTRQAQGGVPFIRGIGTNSAFVGNEPSVAMFVDDVYVVSGNAAVFDFNNISGIEVLKGPQGTLFGRNATGGVIHIKTRNPTYEPTADATIGYANYDTVTAQFYGSTGITDKIAFNIAAFYTNQQEGWGKNFSTIRQRSLTAPVETIEAGSQDAFWNKSWGVRGKLLFEASDETSVLLTAGYSYRYSDQGYANRVVSGLLGRGGYSPEALGLGFYDTVESIGDGYKVNFQQYSGKVTHDFGPVNLVSITAYSSLRVDADLDLDASPQNFLNSYNNYGADTFTQEVQLLSAEDAAVKWIIGGFYMEDDSFFQGRYSGTATTASGVQRIQIGDGRMKSKSYSAFAQTVFEALTNTNVTIGLRYTSDERRTVDSGGGFTLYDGTVVVRRGPFNDKVTFGSLTGRLSIDHKFSDDFMGYIAYNRGFKSGVYNIAGYSPAVTTALEPVKPEEISAYSIGFKSEFWDNRIRFNVEAYYYDYKNIQVQNNRPDGGGTIFINGGAATIKGIDLDLTVAPIDNLTLTAGMTILDGKYDEFKNGPTFFPTGQNAPIAIPASCNFTAYPVSTAPMVQILPSPTDSRACDLSGNKTVQTPPFTLSFSATYKIISSIGDIDLAASWLHTGRQYFEPDNFPLTRQPLYDNVNASIKLTPSEHFDVKFWVNNLLDEKYYAYIGNSATSGTKGAPAAPRMYGMTIGAHF